MRLYAVLASSTLLAACSGGGATTVNSTPAPVSGGNGSGSSAPAHSMVNPTEARTYAGVGASQVFDYSTDDRVLGGQQGVMFASNASTVRDSKIAITYDPRDAIFTLSVRDPVSGATTNTRFQDPASRTDFGGAEEPQWGTPEMSNPDISYLQAGDGNPRSRYESSGSGLIYYGTNTIAPDGEPGSSYQSTSLFTLKPGAVTKYVSFAGYARNSLEFEEEEFEGELVFTTQWLLERGAFAFGEATEVSKVPKTGSGTYTGLMIGSMVYNPTLDGQDPSGSTVLPTYFQWLEGTASLAVDFATSLFQLALQGNVLAPQIDRFTDPQTTVLPAGATFRANGKGSINMVNFGGFKGAFDAASFTAGGTQRTVAIAGSSIDGAFYGPAAEEAGGGFRIVGGNPDERVDIVGAFVGKK